MSDEADFADELSRRDYEEGILQDRIAELEAEKEEYAQAAKAERRRAKIAEEQRAELAAALRHYADIKNWKAAHEMGSKENIMGMRRSVNVAQQALAKLEKE